MNHWIILVTCLLGIICYGCGTDEGGLKLYDTCDSFSDACDLDGAYFGEQRCLQAEGIPDPICTTECRVSKLETLGTFDSGTCYDFGRSCDDYYFGCGSGCCLVTTTYSGSDGSGSGVDGWVYGEGYCTPALATGEVSPRESGQGPCGD